MVDWREGERLVIAGSFFSSDLAEGVQQFLSLAGVRRNRPSLPVRMMEEWEGAGSDVVDDVDCIRGYVCNLCPRVASGRLLSAYGCVTVFSTICQ